MSRGREAPNRFLEPFRGTLLVDGYAGYGAPNAAIRLAAQARLARPLDIPGIDRQPRSA